MTKSELVEAFATQKGLSLAVADRIIDEIFGYMSKTLISDNRIEIRGFGSFENRQYNGHIGRNPKTGVPTTVKPKKHPFFKVGKELRERILLPIR
jgi:integration host factor subunit beta